MRLTMRIFSLIQCALKAPAAAIGGQAVMEGVMMRSPSHWSVALRRHNGDITELHRTFESYGKRHGWARVPVIRGVVALGESLAIGFRALSVSAHYAAEWYDEEDEDGVGTGDLAASAMVSPPGVVSAAPHLPHSHQPDLPPAVSADDIPPVAPASAQDAPASSGATAHDAASPTSDASPRAKTPADEAPEATPENLKTWQIALAFVFAIGFSVLLFKIAPLTVANTLLPADRTGAFVLLEGLIRVFFFCMYLLLIGLLPDMKRVFQYHSAEHKAINAWESGVELTPSLVNAQSRIHVRCGTAFLLWVFVVAILVFGIFGEIVGDPNIYELIASRVLLLPLIAGISFELIRFAGRYPRNKALRAILAPGLWLQHLTTRECTDEQCEVSIKALQVVLAREYPDKSEAEALAAVAAEEVEVMA